MKKGRTLHKNGGKDLKNCIYMDSPRPPQLYTPRRVKKSISTIEGGGGNVQNAKYISLIYCILYQATCPLSQSVLLSLIQQLSVDLQVSLKNVFLSVNLSVYVTDGKIATGEK